MRMAAPRPVSYTHLYAAQPVVCNGEECRFSYVTPAQGKPVYRYVALAIFVMGIVSAAYGLSLIHI